MSKSIRVFAVPTIFLATLSACGGGGGGSLLSQAPGAGPAGFGPEATFTSFSAVKPNTTAVMTGISQTGSGTASAFKLDEVKGSSSARVGYDSGGNPAALSFSSPSSSVTFASGNTRTDEKTGRRTSFAGFDSTSNGVMVDPS